MLLCFLAILFKAIFIASPLKQSDSSHHCIRGYSTNVQGQQGKNFACWIWLCLSWEVSRQTPSCL